jgi:hypothetical protein
VTVVAPQIDLPGGSRADRFVYEVIDTSGNPAGEIHPAVTEDGSNSAPRVRTSIQGSTFRTFDNVRLVPDEADLNPRVDRVRPSWVDVDGVAYPLGVYRLIDLSVVQFSGGDHIEVTCADESSTHHSPTTRSLSWPKSFEVADIIDQLAGVLDVGVVDADPTTALLGEALAFPAGSIDWFGVYEKVAAAAGMLTPYFDLSGAWRWRTAPDWVSVIPDHVWSTSSDAPLAQRRIVQQTLARSVTLLDAPNVFYAVNTAAKGAPIRGRYALPASAPNSIERTGVEVAEWEENAGLGSQHAADAAARAMSAQAMDDVGSAQVSVAFDPRLDVYDAVEADGLMYRCVGWNARLTAGAVTDADLKRAYRATDPDGDYFAGAV